MACVAVSDGNEEAGDTVRKPFVGSKRLQQNDAIRPKGLHNYVFSDKTMQKSVFADKTMQRIF